MRRWPSGFPSRWWSPEVAGRYLGPVQWRPLGQNREQTAMLQPSARVGLEWLFQQIGRGSGVRQGVWVVDLGPSIRGTFRALAIQGPDGSKQAFVDLEIVRDEKVGEDLLSGVLRIEPGLLTYSGAIPLTPWTSDALASWLDGPGFEIPDSDGAVTYFVGLVEMTDAGPRWPDDPPLSNLGADGYTSQVYTSQAAIDAVLGAPPIALLADPPHAHTGPARVWVEACAAAGRRFSSRVPSGCSAAPGRVHLLWSTGAVGARVAWALDISDAGLIAWPMRVTDLTRPILTWIEDDSLTGTAARLAWLYVLADLEPDPAGEPIEVLSSADLADAYQDGGPLVMAGWVAPDYDGTPGLNLASVLGGTLDQGVTAERYVSRLVTITVTAAGSGNPTANVTVGSPTEWRPDRGRCLLYVGDPTGATPLQCHPTYIGPVEGYDSAPVVCCYTSDEELEVLRYWVEIEYPASDDDEEAYGSCTTGGAGYRAHAGGLGKLSIGYGTERPPARIIGIGSVSTGSSGWEDLTWQDWGPDHQSTNYDSSLWPGVSACGAPSWYGESWAEEMGEAPGGPGTYWYFQRMDMRLEIGKAVGTVNTLTITGGDVRQIGVYWPQLCPQGWWLATVSVATDHTDRIEWRKTPYTHACQYQRLGYWYNPTTSPPSGAWVRGPIFGGAPWGDWGLYWYTGAPESGYTQEPGPLQWDSTATLRLAGRDYSAGDWTDWDPWWPAPEEAATIGVTALLAASGAAIYLPYPEAEWERIGIGDAAPVNLALGWAGA